MIYVLLILIFLSVVVGFLGRRSRFGFWGYFFASLLLTPLVGLLLVISGWIPKSGK